MNEIDAVHVGGCNGLCGPDGHYLAAVDGVRVEYGVVVDRTSDGLGFYLAHASESLPTAQAHAELQPEKYPVEIKQRRVLRSDWQPLNPPDVRP